MNLLSIYLAILSGLGHTTAYLDYNRSTFQGKTKPNGATWAIWATLALVSASTYVAASGDIWKCVISIINIALCIGTFVLALCCDKFQKLDVTDWMALVLGLVAVVVWKLSTAAYANIVVQIAIIIGFIPTWRLVRRNPLHEHPRPWWIWAATYCIAVTVVILRWRGQWIDLLYPVNCVILHASVPLLALVRPKQKPTPERIFEKVVLTEELEWGSYLVGRMPWWEARDEIKKMGGGWRLPTTKELQEALAKKVPCFVSYHHWSGDTHDFPNQEIVPEYVDMEDGNSRTTSQIHSFYVRPVRVRSVS